MDKAISRRTFLSSISATTVAFGLAACVPQTRIGAGLTDNDHTKEDNQLEALLASYTSIYGAKKDGNFTIPAVPFKKIDPQFLRQVVDDPTGELPGTIVVDTKRRYLYLVAADGKAIRYGVGIGRAGFAWSGRAIIQFKRAWPTWTPPKEMIARQPELIAYSAENGGMSPGLHNPLGARALYIYQGGRDTLYRLHGSPEWWSIGKSVSSGCVRLTNQDVIDLYDRVDAKTPILVV